MSLLARMRNVFRSERLSVELDDELAFHLAERQDEFMAQGMSEREARRKARAVFGNYSIQKETTRDMNLAAWLEASRNDLSFGLRQLRLNPGFTVIAVLSLALGIGANTAIFQLVDSIRLRGLPVQEPSRLALVDNGKDFFYAGSYTSNNVAFASAQVEALRQNQQAFTDFLTFNDTQFNLSKGGQSRYAAGLFVSPNFLKLLGLTPLIGHAFSTASDSTCEAPGAVLNYAFWQSEFGGDVKAIGKTISLNGHRFPIIGVTPASFLSIEPGQRFDVAVPQCVDGILAEPGKSRAKSPTAFWLTAIGRLKPGWSIERASNHLRDISPTIMRSSLPAEYRPADAKKYLNNKMKATSASAGVSPMRRRYENPLWVLMSISGMVLLIACFNLANLLLARASAREREIAVRQAIGASRPRLVSQLLCESLLLAAFGGLLGAALAQILSRGMVLFLSSPQNEVALPLGVDWRTFAFTAGLALFTCLLFGLLPALRASGANPASAMRGGRTSTATRERNGLRRTLVVSQVAFSLMLLVAAVLFTRSLQNLLAQPSGFNSQNVLAVSVTADGDAFSTAERRRELFRQVEMRFRSTPGVASTASVGFTPFSGYGWNGRVHGDADASSVGGKESWFNRAGSQYFATMSTPVLAGREFTSRDNITMPNVAVVNEAFSKRFFGGKNPVGRTFRVEEKAGKTDPIYQVVGMVGNTKYNELNEDARPIAFLPVDQDKDPNNGRTFMIRGRGSLDPLMHAIELEAKNINPALLLDFKVLDVQIQQSLLRERLMANLSGGFGILAACLSTLGLYGVMSYLVARRRTEIGLRLALGAARSNVMKLVLKDAAKMVAIGLVVGIAGSLLLARFAESLLYGLKGGDPATLATAAALLTLAALGATLIPAQRAAWLEPVAALREE